MKKTAVINIGSNSAKLLDVSCGGIGFRHAITCRLQEGKHGGYLDTGSIRRTAAAVCELWALAKKRGARLVDIYATEALRSAHNASELARLVYAETGREIEIVSGELEARFAYLGATASFPKAESVTDIGGASTEFAFADGTAYSFPVGAVLLTERCGQDLSLLLSEADKEISPTCKSGFAVGVGGTFSSLAALTLGLTEYDREAVHGTKISAERLFSFEREFAPLSYEEICARHPLLGEKRAQVLKAGLGIAVVALKRLGADGFTVSSTDGLHGYLLSANGKAGKKIFIER